MPDLDNTTNGGQSHPKLTPAELAKLESLARTDPKLAAWLREYTAAAMGQALPEAAPGDPWQAFSLSDAYQERPPIEGIIQNGANPILELPSLNMVYGPPGSLKSFLLQDLLTCAAGGAVWLPPAPNYQVEGYKTRPGPVMWIDFDNGQRRTLDRFSALGKAHKLQPGAPLVFYSMPTPWLLSTDKAQIGDLAARITKSGAQLVCIDNLGCVLGDAEENSGDMAGVMSNFRQLAEDTGAAIAIIHHQRKGNGIDGRAGDTLRGHSSIEAALDLALRIERDPGQPVISIRATKTRGADVPTIRALFEFENDQRGIMQAARFASLGVDSFTHDAITGQVLEALAEGPKKITALTLEVSGATGEGEKRVRSAIEIMITQNKIKITNGKQGAKVCELP